MATKTLRNFGLLPTPDDRNQDEITGASRASSTRRGKVGDKGQTVVSTGNGNYDEEERPNLTVTRQEEVHNNDGLWHTMSMCVRIVKDSASPNK